jgi:hypothetical protein
MYSNYCVSGLARSGHHAVLYWLAGMMPAKVIFFNTPDYNALKEGFIDAPSSPVIFNDHLPGNIDIFNLENRTVRETSAVKLSPLFEKPVFTVYVIRDVYNNLASCTGSTLKRKDFSQAEMTARLHQRCKCWINHAENALLYSRIPEGTVSEDLMYFIKYPDWRTDEEYRRTVADQLGLEYNEKYLDYIPGHGDGSSFSGLKYQNRAYLMDVNRRYKQMKDNKLYLSLFRNFPEMEKLNEKLFGFRLNLS